MYMCVMCSSVAWMVMVGLHSSLQSTTLHPVFLCSLGRVAINLHSVKQSIRLLVCWGPQRCSIISLCFGVLGFNVVECINVLRNAGSPWRDSQELVGWLKRATITNIETKSEPSFIKLNLSHINLVCFFPAHLQAWELFPQPTPSHSPQNGHNSRQHKNGWGFQAQKVTFYSTFPRQRCDDTGPPSRMTYLSSPLQQA